MEPEVLLRLATASLEMRRVVDDDEIWRSKFGELLAVAPSVAQWPERAQRESCVRWYLRCRALAQWSADAAEAFAANEFPFLGWCRLRREKKRKK